MHTKQSNAYEMYTNRKERLGDFTLRVSDWWLHLMLYLDTKATNYFMYWCVVTCYWGAMVGTFGTVWLIGADRHLYGHLIISISKNETIDIEEGRLDAVKPSRRYLVSGQAILEKLKRSRVLVYWKLFNLYPLPNIPCCIALAIDIPLINHAFSIYCHKRGSRCLEIYFTSEFCSTVSGHQSSIGREG